MVNISVLARWSRAHVRSSMHCGRPTSPKVFLSLFSHAAQSLMYPVNGLGRGTETLACFYVITSLTLVKFVCEGLPLPTIRFFHHPMRQATNKPNCATFDVIKKTESFGIISSVL